MAPGRERCVTGNPDTAASALPLGLVTPNTPQPNGVEPDQVSQWGQDDVPTAVPVLGVECPPQEQNSGCRSRPFPSLKQLLFGVSSRILHIFMLGVSKLEMGKISVAPAASEPLPGSSQGLGVSWGIPEAGEGRHSQVGSD